MSTTTLNPQPYSKLQTWKEYDDARLWSGTWALGLSVKGGVDKGSPALLWYLNPKSKIPKPGGLDSSMSYTAQQWADWDNRWTLEQWTLFLEGQEYTESAARTGEVPAPETPAKPAEAEEEERPKKVPRASSQGAAGTGGTT